MIDIDEFVQHYVTCLLWSETVDDVEEDPDEYGELPQINADYRYGPDDIAPEAMAEIRGDCSGFVAAHGDLLLAMGETAAELQPNVHRYFDPEGDGGHNFCLSRNGHGTGFWDRGLGELGDRLHDAAKFYGTQGLYVADDGLLYVHG
jgi:hypothetical protein